MTDIGYIVIGNFASLYDNTLGKRFNKESGLTELSFLFLMKTFAQDHDRHVVFQSDDALVMRGTKEHLKQLRRENGGRFSYAFTDQKGLEILIRAEADAQEHLAQHGAYSSQRKKHPQTLYLDA